MAARQIVVASEEEFVLIIHFAPCRNLKRRKLGRQAIAATAEDKLRQGGGARLPAVGQPSGRLWNRWSRTELDSELCDFYR